ncbi:MAG TPA: hypothetical protein VGR43_00930 [Dehalococcoidia bacterium]|jgi:hypothetical protein|nr:hypothetical protein [Dehalococcoidia bacterium]
MPVVELLETLVLTLLQPGYQGPVEGPDFPFTYVRGHPSFQGQQLPIPGPYRLVVARDRLLYAGERRQKPIFQLPNELIRSMRGQGTEQLTIRVGDNEDWVDIDFRPTGLTKRRDMKRLVAAVRGKVEPR